MPFFDDYFTLLNKTLGDLDLKLLEQAAGMILETRKSGRKVLLLGNGGSATMASHVAVDLTKNAGVRAMTFNEYDLITCLANDFGHDQWMAKALELYADPGDLLILISSSGKSANILRAAEKAKSLGLKLITFSGFKTDNPLRSLGNLNLWANSKGYNIVELTHQAWLLALVDRIIGKVEYLA